MNEQEKLHDMLDQIRKNAEEIARLKVERDRAMREYQQATKDLFEFVTKTKDRPK